MWEAAGKPVRGDERWGNRWIDWYIEHMGEPPRPSLDDAANNFRRVFLFTLGIAGILIEGNKLVVWLTKENQELREIIGKEYHGYDIRIEAME
jgi:hypothetical protein